MVLERLVLFSLWIAAALAGGKSPRPAHNITGPAVQAVTTRPKPLAGNPPLPDDVGLMMKGGFDLKKILDEAEKRVQDVKDQIGQPEDAGNMRMEDVDRYTFGADNNAAESPDAGEMNMEKTEEEIRNDEFVGELFDFITVGLNAIREMENMADGLAKVVSKAKETADQKDVDQAEANHKEDS